MGENIHTDPRGPFCLVAYRCRIIKGSLCCPITTPSTGWWPTPFQPLSGRQQTCRSSSTDQRVSFVLACLGQRRPHLSGTQIPFVLLVVASNQTTSELPSKARMGGI